MLSVPGASSSHSTLLKHIQCNNITILHLMTFFSSFYFYHHILTLYLQGRGLNYVQINSLWGIIVGSQAIAEIPTGILADKIGRKYAIIMALVLQLAGEILFIFAEHYVMFVIISIIAGIGFSFLSGCFEAVMYDSLQLEGKEDEMQKIIGRNASFSQLAIILGSCIGGFLTSDLKMESFISVIILTACSVAIALVLSCFLQEPEYISSQQERHALALVSTSAKLLRTNKSLQRILLLSLLATPFLNYLLNFYQPYFIEANISGIWFGFILASASLLGVITSNYAYLLDNLFGVSKGILLATLLPGVCYLLMASISHSRISPLLFICAYSSMNLQKPIFADYLNRHIESTNRATVLSMLNMVSGIYVALMGIIIGAIADVSLSSAFFFMGSVILISVLCIRIEDSHVHVKQRT